jgi:hypothetical protein
MFSLLSSSIHLKDICLSISRFLFISAAFPLRRGYSVCVTCAVPEDVDVALSVLLCMHHWLWVPPRCQSSYVVHIYIHRPLNNILLQACLKESSNTSTLQLLR